MEGVVPSQCSHIEISIVKDKLGEATEAIGRLTSRYEATLKPLDLLVVIREADTAQNIYSSEMNVHCNGKKNW